MPARRVLYSTLWILSSTSPLRVRLCLASGMWSGILVPSISSQDTSAGHGASAPIPGLCTGPADHSNQPPSLQCVWLIGGICISLREGPAPCSLARLTHLHPQIPRPSSMLQFPLFTPLLEAQDISRCFSIPRTPTLCQCLYLISA
jgi:hypothetical protein